MTGDDSSSNPYRPSVPDEEGGKSRTKRELRFESTQSLWLAYLIAPVTVPIFFVCLIVLAVVSSSIFGFEINTASVLILPIFAMTVGLLISYAMWLIVGMPIVLLLRKKKKLKGIIINLAAFAIAHFVAICVTGLSAVSDPSGGSAFGAERIYGVLLSVGITTVFLGIPAIVSASTFWFLAKFFESRRNVFL